MGMNAMSLPNRHTRFVLFSSMAQKFEGRARYYVSKDGSMTLNKREATTFYNVADAKHYAEQHKLSLDAYVHIAEEEFTNTELWG
jgi:hypothetical protein